MLCSFNNIYVYACMYHKYLQIHLKSTFEYGNVCDVLLYGGCRENIENSCLATPSPLEN